MVSTENPWQLLHEPLMQIEGRMRPSVRYEKAMRGIVRDNQWIEFDADVLIPEKVNSKHGVVLSVDEINHSIVVTNVVNKDGFLQPFDTILSLNEMNFVGMPKEAAQCIFTAHQGKLVRLRIRRLQPSIVEIVELNVQKDGFLDSPKLGFTINGGIGKNDGNDPGLFIVGIEPKGRAAEHGRLRIGDRLMQVSNTHVTVNLQCIDLDTALKLIKRLRNESTSMALLVAHQN